MPEQPPATLPANFFEQSGGAPPSTLPADFKFEEEKPAKAGVVSRFISGTGVPAMYQAMTKDRPAGEEPLNPMAPGVDQTIRNAWDMVKGVAEASGAHLEAAHHFANKGDYISAIGHTLYATPGIGELGYQTANKFIEGDIAGGLGGLTALFVPKLAAKAPAVVARAVEASDTALSEAGAAARGFVAKPPPGQAIPGTEAMPPMLMDALALHPKTATVGSILKRLSNASDAVDNLRGSRAPVQEPVGGHVFSEATRPQSPNPRVPLYENPEVLARLQPGQTYSMAEANAEMTPVEMQQAIAERAATMRNRNVSGVMDRLKAMSQEQPAAPSTPTPQPAITPAVSPEAPSPAIAEPVTLGEALKNPSEVAKKGSAETRNALREAKVSKVVERLNKGLDRWKRASVHDLTANQWSDVADQAGVNELTPAQIELVKKQFPKD